MDRSNSQGAGGASALFSRHSPEGDVRSESFWNLVEPPLPR
jgi:hypothetical protein